MKNLNFYQQVIFLRILFWIFFHMSHKWIKNHGGQFSANFKKNQFNLGYVWFPQSTKKRKTM